MSGVKSSPVIANLILKWKIKSYSFYFIPLIPLHIIRILRSAEGSEQFHIPVIAGAGPALRTEMQEKLYKNMHMKENVFK